MGEVAGGSVLIVVSVPLFVWNRAIGVWMWRKSPAWSKRPSPAIAAGRESSTISAWWIWVVLGLAIVAAGLTMIVLGVNLVAGGPVGFLGGSLIFYGWSRKRGSAIRQPGFDQRIQPFGVAIFGLLFLGAGVGLILHGDGVIGG